MPLAEQRKVLGQHIAGTYPDFPLLRFDNYTPIFSHQLRTIEKYDSVPPYSDKVQAEKGKRN